MAEFGLSQRRKLNLPIGKIAKIFPTRKRLKDFFIISPSLSKTGFRDAKEQRFLQISNKNREDLFVSVEDLESVRRIERTHSSSPEKTGSNEQ